MRADAVSVIVPVHDGGHAFERCLDSVGRLDPPPGEILVVDDASSDDSAHRAEAAGFRVIRRDRQGGPAVARNQGAAVAAGDVLLFLDADVEAPPGTVGRVASWFGENSAAAVPTPDAVIGSYDDDPGAEGFFSQYRNLLHRWVHQTSRSEVGSFWGACGAVRRLAFEAVGGFDPAYPTASIEDIELGGRLVAAGYRIRLDKELEVKHLKRWTALSILRTDLLRRAIPWTRLILRRRHLGADLNLAPAGRWSAVGALVATAAVLASPWLGVPALAAAAVAAGLVLTLNLPLYRFFCRRRGAGFAVAGAACHWCYFLYAAAGFAAGAVHFAVSGGLGGGPDRRGGER